MTKCLEEDDNRTIHSGADMDASSAATTRDIEEKGKGIDSQCHENTPMDSEHEKSKLESAMNQLTLNTGTCNEQALALGVINQQSIAVAMNKQQPRTSRMNNQPVCNTRRGRQQTTSMGVANQQAMNLSNRRKSCPFALLLPIIQPLLDRNKTLQLQSLYHTLKRNKITKEAFVRRMRTIVGDRMIKMAVYKLQHKAIVDVCVSVNRNVCTGVRMMNAPMAEMPNNPPLKQNEFQFYMANIKEQKNIAPLFPMTYAKPEAVENDNSGKSKNDGFEMQFSQLGVSTSTSQMYCDVPGWMEWDNYAPSRDEKLLLREKLEQLSRLVAEREVELADCKAERDFLFDKNLVLKQELEYEKQLRKGGNDGF